MHSINIGLLASALALSGGVARAQPVAKCPEFSGTFVNVRDSANPVVILKQSGCDDVVLVGNDGTEWKINLAGAPMRLPSKFAAALGRFAQNAVYAARRDANDPSKINLNAFAKVSLFDADLGDSSPKVQTELLYSGEARLTSGGVYVNMTGLRLMNVEATNVEKGEVSGFQQGANIILSMFKSFIAADLVKQP